MSNFENELTQLVNEWLKRGADHESMLAALQDEVERLKVRVEARRP